MRERVVGGSLAWSIILIMTAGSGGCATDDGVGAEPCPDAQCPELCPDASCNDADNAGDADSAITDGGDDERSDAGQNEPHASERIGPQGGEISAFGLALTFPPGALTEEAEITIVAGDDVMEGYEAYSPVWDVGPAGLSLALPAIARMEFQGDALLASAFWVRNDGGVDTLEGTVAGQELTVEIDHLSIGWVGNGLEIPPRHREPDCGAIVRLIHGGPLTQHESSSAVAAVIAVEDCDGTPVRNLTRDDFVPLEDGRPLSVEAHGFTVLEQRPSMQIVVTLALDFSSSTDGMRQEVIAAARTFVDSVEAANVPLLIGVLPFAGGETRMRQGFHMEGELLEPTVEYDLVRERLDALVAYEARDPGATNLNGAVQTAYEASAIEARRVERRNRGGAFAVPLVVVFTDGRDTAGRGGEVPPGSIFAVALQSPDYDRGALETLIGGSSFARNLFELSDVDLLQRHFGRVASLLASRINGAFYRVGYCSPTREGSHSFSLEIDAANATVSDAHLFEARSGECSASLFENACEGRECGGFGCGACDDREAVCNGSQCVSWCETVGMCADAAINNPLGHAQECSVASCTGAKQPVFHRGDQYSGDSYYALGAASVRYPGRIMAAASNGDVIIGPSRISRYDLDGQMVWQSDISATLPFGGDGNRAVIADNGDLYFGGVRVDIERGALVWDIDDSSPMVVFPDGGVGIIRSDASAGASLAWFDADGQSEGSMSLGLDTSIPAACATDDGGFWLLEPSEGEDSTTVHRYDAEHEPHSVVILDGYAATIGSYIFACSGNSAFVGLTTTSDVIPYGTGGVLYELTSDGKSDAIAGWGARSTDFVIRAISAKHGVVAVALWSSSTQPALSHMYVDLVRPRGHDWDKNTLLRLPATRDTYGFGTPEVVGNRAVVFDGLLHADPEIALHAGEADETTLGDAFGPSAVLLHDPSMPIIIPPSDFECDDGVFLPPEQVCDGETQCEDGYDEVDCDGDPNYFECGDGSMLPLNYVCDGEAQCADASDESDCGDSGMPDELLDCSDPDIMPLQYACDGIVQCQGGTDEAFCQ